MMGREPPGVPEGKDPVERFIKHLASGDGYGSPAVLGEWKKDGYFDGVSQHKRGVVLLKYLHSPPGMEELAEFRTKAVEKAAGKLDDSG